MLGQVNSGESVKWNGPNGIPENCLYIKCNHENLFLYQQISCKFSDLLYLNGNIYWHIPINYTKNHRTAHRTFLNETIIHLIHLNKYVLHFLHSNRICTEMKEFHES